MKRLFLLALLFILGNAVFAQLEVKEGSFRMVRGFVNINQDKMYDDNNQPYAVLKIKTENIGSKERRELSFKGDGQTFIEVEYHDGEVWVYLSYYATFLKISHEEYSSTEFYFPLDMKPKCGYEMTLVNKVYAPTTNARDMFNYMIITSDQPNALIYIDDVYVGDGQVSKSFKVGERHRWRMECNMYHTESGEVTILADQKVRIEKKMFPAFGFLNITSQPENGATVFIDGNRVGVTPYKSDRLASGEHKIRIIKEMFGASEQTVIVNDEETLDLDMTMRANFAMVSITTDSQSDIYIDDEKKGTGSWSGRLSAGEHIFEAKKASHKTSVMTAVLEENSNKSLVIDNPEPIYGSVDINSDPMDCIVYVDGVRKGETPVVLNSILIGNHQIRLEKEGYQTITKSITVTEDKMVAINEKLTKGFTMPNGVVAYYPFEGNANDMSGKGNHGKPEGATFTTGFLGQCAHFGGFHNSQIIRIPNSNTLKFDNAATFAFWFKLDSYDGMDGYGRKSSEGLMRFYAKNFDRG